MEIFGVKDGKQANCFAPSTETAEKGAFGAFQIMRDFFLVEDSRPNKSSIHLRLLLEVFFIGRIFSKNVCFNYYYYYYFLKDHLSNVPS